MDNLIKYENDKKIKFIRLKRLLFAFNHHSYLKRHWSIKYLLLNALFGKIIYDPREKLMYHNIFYYKPNERYKPFLP